MAPGAAAGWYPDPLGRHEQRYWDGTAWTTHVVDGDRRGEDPLVAPPPESVAAPPPAAPAASDLPATPAPSTHAATHPSALPAGWHTDPLGHADLRWWDGTSWTTHVATGGRRWEDALATPAGIGGPTAAGQPPRRRPSRPGSVGAAALAAMVLGVGLFVGLRLGDDGGGDDGGGPTAVEVLGEGTPGTPVTGFLELGVPAEPTTTTVGPDGATITTPGGTVITVPEGAHPDDVTYTVTERPITGHSFGSLVNPASVLVGVDNGGGYADGIVELRIPVDAPPDTQAMAVFYDDTTGRLEPVPALASDDETITVATRHFSSIFVTYVDLVLLTDGTIDSGFRPGVDSWQYVNYGSYLAPSGHCSGQSLSALWYYTQQRQALGASALFGRYDDRIDTRRLPATPRLQWDDHDAYRLASMVQRDEVATLSDAERRYDRLADARLDALQYYTFAYSILLTGEPQYVGIYRAAGGGHAMIVYGVTADGLLVADPNYPSAYQTIPWNARTGVLGPYQAQSDAATPPAAYETVAYYGKTALVDWTNLGGRWEQFVDGTIGDGTFPTGALQVREVDDEGNVTWVPLVDGYQVADDVDRIVVRRDAPAWTEGLKVYRWDQWLATGTWNGPVTVPLVKGANRLGVSTWGRVNGNEEWVAFDRLNVLRGELDEPDLDLVFVIDLTSSMEDDIAGVKTAATSIVRRVAATNEDWRVAIVGYRDVGDSPMFEDFAFSSDEAAVVANISALTVSGGGDEPEAVLEALSRAIDATTIGGWRDGFPNKQIILMGDAPGHVPGSGGETHESVAREAELADPVVVQSIVVGNSGYISPEAEADFSELSRLTFGSTFSAEDADQVPAALEDAIGYIGTAPVPAATGGDGTDWPRALLLVVSLLLVVGGAAVLGRRLLRPPVGSVPSAEPVR